MRRVTASVKTALNELGQRQKIVWKLKGNNLQKSWHQCKL